MTASRLCSITQRGCTFIISACQTHRWKQSSVTRCPENYLKGQNLHNSYCSGWTTVLQIQMLCRHTRFQAGSTYPVSPVYVQCCHNCCTNSWVRTVDFIRLQRSCGCPRLTKRGSVRLFLRNYEHKNRTDSTPKGKPKNYYSPQQNLE